MDTGRPAAYPAPAPESPEVVNAEPRWVEIRSLLLDTGSAGKAALFAGSRCGAMVRRFRCGVLAAERVPPVWRWDVCRKRRAPGSA